jgi:salicylate hydroxylase
VPKDLWSPDVILWAGPRTHLVHYPLRRGEIYNLVAVFHSKRYVEGWNAEADAGELWAHFEGQRPEVLRMLERIETWRMWVLCDREPVKEWSKGRVTLLGDAAHPMLQYLAQGACMATEDAVRLAENASENPENLPAAFQAYVQQRYLRTARVQIMARVYGEFYHAGGVAKELRNLMLGSRTAEDAMAGLESLYGEQRELTRGENKLARTSVIAGLDPAIHAAVCISLTRRFVPTFSMDHRVKPGGDAHERQCFGAAPPRATPALLSERLKSGPGGGPQILVLPATQVFGRCGVS